LYCVGGWTGTEVSSKIEYLDIGKHFQNYLPHREEETKHQFEKVVWINLRLKTNPFEATMNSGIFAVEDCMVIFGG